MASGDIILGNGGKICLTAAGKIILDDTMVTINGQDVASWKIAHSPVPCSIKAVVKRYVTWTSGTEVPRGFVEQIGGEYALPEILISRSYYQFEGEYIPDSFSTVNTADINQPAPGESIDLKGIYNFKVVGFESIAGNRISPVVEFDTVSVFNTTTADAGVNSYGVHGYIEYTDYCFTHVVWPMEFLDNGLLNLHEPGINTYCRKLKDLTMYYSRRSKFSTLDAESSSFKIGSHELVYVNGDSVIRDEYHGILIPRFNLVEREVSGLGTIRVPLAIYTNGYPSPFIQGNPGPDTASGSFRFSGIETV